MFASELATKILEEREVQTEGPGQQKSGLKTESGGRDDGRKNRLFTGETVSAR
jgi:hypothetical protein